MTVNKFEKNLLIMRKMQERHNCEIHPEWRFQGYDYLRAIWIECAELLDHYGWKWWKNQESALDQVQLEIVDIWHFGLSILIRDELVNRKLSELIVARAARPASYIFPIAVERLAVEALNGRFNVERFIDMMNALPMSIDKLFEVYVGKNILNQFRHRHGYKTGEYVKTWDGLEDNEHLSRIVQNIDVSSSAFESTVLARLEAIYPG